MAALGTRRPFVPSIKSTEHDSRRQSTQPLQTYDDPGDATSLQLVNVVWTCWSVVCRRSQDAPQ